MACPCSSSSHWWHAPIYFSFSLVLAAISITSPPSTTTTTTNAATNLSPPPLSFNATAALLSHGFSITATLLPFSSDLLRSSSSATFFAVHDSALSNLSTSPSAVKLLLRYHTLPSKLSLHQLLLLPLNSCIPTSLPSKNLTITNADPNNRSIEINNVRVSHPDLFLDDSLSIHGVLAPFTPLTNPHEVETHSGLDAFIPSSPCSFLGPNPRPKSTNAWTGLIRTLSSNGFVSFAIGLNSVLDKILKDNPNLGPITVFAPLGFNFFSSSGGLLDRVVRYHIVGRRYTYSELDSLPKKDKMRTLLRGKVLEITSSVNGSRALAINGVDVVSPDVVSTEMFVVHGIPRAFEFQNHANS